MGEPDDALGEPFVLLPLVVKELELDVRQVEVRNHAVGVRLAVAVLVDDWPQHRHHPLLEPVVVLALGRGGQPQGGDVRTAQGERVLLGPRTVALIDH